MAEDIKVLIDKINEEGIAAARHKSEEIENQARQKAAQILEKAKSEADRLLAEAKEQMSRMNEKEKALLSQAGRDLMLELRQEINLMLERLITRQVHDTLEPENLFKILSAVIKNAALQEKAEVVVSLNKEDLKALEHSFLVKLKEETKRKVVLQPQGSIQAGFVISFDAGKSQFDFTDKALAEYIGTYLKPKLKEILQG